MARKMLGADALYRTPSGQKSGFFDDALCFLVRDADRTTKEDASMELA